VRCGSLPFRSVRLPVTAGLGAYGPWRRKVSYSGSAQFRPLIDRSRQSLSCDLISHPWACNWTGTSEEPYFIHMMIPVPPPTPSPDYASLDNSNGATMHSTFNMKRKLLSNRTLSNRRASAKPQIGQVNNPEPTQAFTRVVPGDTRMVSFLQLDNPRS
jgi:hypothetical protein